jgi:ankyrin repeat protein
VKAPPALHTSLWSAARANDVRAIERLLAEGLDIDARDAQGFSPLMLAAMAGHAAAFDLLLDRGADPNTADLGGNSVLMGAAFKGHVDIVRKLLAAGADPTLRNHAGLDAHGFAVTVGRSEVATLLPK